jgi:hypothetical protein
MPHTKTGTSRKKEELSCRCPIEKTYTKHNKYLANQNMEHLDDKFQNLFY